MPLLKRCCCCCLDLRQGSLVIGILSLLLIGVGEAIVAIYCLVDPEVARKRIKFENALFFDTEEDSEVAYIVFFSILLLVAFIYIIVCLVLIYAVRYKKRFLLMPWIFFTFMNMVMAVAGAVMTLLHSYGYALHIIVGFLALGIASTWIYFTIVVFSFFQALQDGDYW